MTDENKCPVCSAPGSNIKRDAKRILLERIECPHCGTYLLAPEFHGQYLQIVGEHYPIEYAKNHNEFIFYVDHLHARYLTEKKASDRMRLTAKGWDELHKLKMCGADSKAAL